jgi:hypothetical protein
MYPEDVNGVNSGCDWFPCNGDYQHDGLTPVYTTSSNRIVIEIGPNSDC